MVFKHKINKRDFMNAPNTTLKKLIIKSLAARSLRNLQVDIVDKELSFKITKKRGRITRELPFCFSGYYFTERIEEDAIHENITLNINTFSKK